MGKDLVRQAGGFHRIAPGDVEHWDFSADQVIAYLRCKRDSKTPAWKRLKILEGIMNYRVMIQNASIDFLIPIRNKMKEIILIERSRESEQTTVKESLDYVNPKECDAIQQYRVCLLYTSPSPRDLSTSRMPSSA